MTENRLTNPDCKVNIPLQSPIHESKNSVRLSFQKGRMMNLAKVFSAPKKQVNPFLTVGSVMNTGVVTVTPEDSFEKSMEIMARGGVRHLVITDDKNNVKGVLADRHLLRFAAVDAQTREILQFELLRIWQLTRKTIILVTHSIDDAVYLSDRIVVLKPHPGEVREIIEHPLLRPRVKSSPDFARMVAQLEGLIGVESPAA